MIINFTVQNYRSFRDLANLTMEADNYRANAKALTEAPSHRSVLPAAGIFGANASGKSNFVHALAYFRDAVLGYGHFGNVTTHQYLAPFMRRRGDDSLMSFEIELFNPQTEVEYAFGFRIQGHCIPEEWFEVTERKEKNVTKHQIYHRKRTQITFDHSVANDLTKYADNLQIDVGNLTITRLAGLVQYKVAKDFVEEIRKIDIYGNFVSVDFEKLHYDTDNQQKIARALREADTGIIDFSIKEAVLEAGMPNDLQTAIRNGQKFYHLASSHRGAPTIDGQPIKFDFDDESLGTQKILGHAQHMLEAIKNGGVLVIDEIETSLHPYLVGKIVKTFLDPEMNKRGAQLIFTSHSEYLLSRDVGLRPDQIYITEKGNNGQSSLTPLSDFDIRSDAAINEKFIRGYIGGVPNIDEGGFDFND